MTTAKPKGSEETSVPVPLRPPQTPNGWCWDWNGVSAGRDRKLTTSAMARPTTVTVRRSWRQIWWYESQYIRSNTTINLFSISSTTCFGPTGHRQVVKNGRINSHFRMETEISVSCTDNTYIRKVSKFLLVLGAKLGEVDKKKYV